MRRKLQWLIIFLVAVLGAAQALPGAPPVVKVMVYPSQDGVAAGQTIKLAVVLTMQAGYHVQSHTPNSPDYIPTTLTLEGATVGAITWPTPELLKVDSEELSVYSGQASIMVPLTAPTDATTVLHITGTLRYQACGQAGCLMPTKVPVSLDIPILPAGATPHPLHPDVFPAAPAGGPPAEPPTGLSDAQAAQASLVDTIHQRGWTVALFLIFLQGLALDLTPCVYPLIPITMSFFGSQSAGDVDPRRQRVRTFLLAATYVLGMCTTYSLLGVAASLTGHLFGSALQSPVVLGFVAVTFFALSLSMLGAYELTVPSSIASRIESKRGVWGALFMGLFVGIVAAPCVGPFVLSLVTLVGSLGNPVTGFWLFFTLALGMGLPFLILGWFSGSTRALPRSGAWMVWIKKVMGMVMMGIALWYLRSLIPPAFFRWLIPVFVLGASVWVGFFEATRPTKPPGFLRLKHSVGVAGALVGLFMLWGAHAASNAAETAWVPFESSVVEHAAADDQPVVIDFSARWCTDCTQLDEKTYSDPRVIQALSGFVKLKADLTQDEDPKVKALYKQYAIQGLPTVIFLNPHGQEIPSLRLTGFEKPDDFLRRVATARTGG